MRRAALALAIVLVTAAGCTPDADLSVSVNGNLGAPVTVSIDGSRVPDTVTKEVLTQGEGREVDEGSYVLLRATSFDSRSGAVIESYDTGNVRLTTADSDGLGELASEVTGEAEGSRILVTRPGLAGEDDGAEIVVVDILSTTAQGEEVPLPKKTPEGTPTLKDPTGNEPKISEGGGKIPDLVVLPLIKGTGPQLESTDTLAMQYKLADTKGKTVQSSWDGGGPATARVSDLMDGMQIGLTDEPVGSRILLLIPSAQAQGEGDMVMIVDILATLPSDDAAATDY